VPTSLFATLFIEVPLPREEKYILVIIFVVFITYTKIITRIYFSSRGKGTSIKSVANKLVGTNLPS
jgi:hypothetical protein